MKEKDSYLTMVIDGRFNLWDENRLTKVFCASFNESALFRKLFLKFINCESYSKKKLFAKSQWCPEPKSGILIDVVIGTLDNNSYLKKPLIIIENKTNSPLYDRQLTKYDNILKKYKDVDRVALAKNYFDSYGISWHIKHWSEFYHDIITQYKRIQKFTLDKFIIDNFLNYLKINNMAIPSSIKQSELNSIYYIFDITNKLNNNKFGGRSLKKYRPFEISINFLDMLRGLISRAKDSSIIGKTKKFQFNPRISRWEDSDGTKHPSISTYIMLKKNKKNYRSLQTGLYFKGNKATIESHVVDTKGNILDERVFKGKEIKFDYYCNETIKYWERKLKSLKLVRRK